MDFQKVLNEIYEEVNAEGIHGKVASYIPELASVDASKFGICLVTPDGDSFGVGDFEEKFSIQSISKVFSLVLSIIRSDNKIWERVGREPSGTPFNSLVQLESENGIPRNPFINSGALVVTDFLVSETELAAQAILDFIIQEIGVGGIHFNEAVAQSEIIKGDRNRALSYFMKSFDNFDNEVDKVIKEYCYQCSIEMSCKELAQAFLLFTNKGRSIYTDKQLLTLSQTKRISALMETCGCYDQAGDFAFKVGLPVKSGVGGGIAAVLPDKFSVVVWSPELNEKGNSAKGFKALELLTTKLGCSLY